MDVEVIVTVLAYIAPAKLACMTEAVLRRERGRTIHRYGEYTFGEVHVLAIRPDAVSDNKQ